MVKGLRESKARLSELVDLASRGEDVLISVRGKVKARLTRATPAGRASNGSAWARELRALHKAYCVAPPKISVEQILAESRQDRF